MGLYDVAYSAPDRNRSSRSPASGRVLQGSTAGRSASLWFSDLLYLYLSSRPPCRYHRHWQQVPGLEDGGYGTTYKRIPGICNHAARPSRFHNS